jgi:hypothetical protein
MLLLQHHSYIIIGLAFFFYISPIEALEKRQEFTIPLAKISVGTDSITGKFNKAKITFSDEREQIIITSDHDILIKNTNKGTEKSLFREDPSRSFLLSAFEADAIGKISKGFIQTLEIFEHDLKNQKYDQIRYLDGFFPKFLKNFKILLQLAKNDNDKNSINLLIPDSSFDVSLSSPKTDARIKMWQTQKDYIMKLRIAAKELTFQLKQWESKELVSGQDIDIIKNAKVEQTIDLFIKVYFNRTTEMRDIQEKRIN